MEKKFLTSITMKRRHFFAIGLSSALTPDIVLAGSDIVAHVQEPRYLGRTDAPIQVIEFFSMTCSHCASFHKKTFPEIKKRLIDSGMLRFEMRAFPLDGLSLRAHAMARVLSKEKYYPMVGMLLEKQTNWANAKDPIEALRKLGRLAGMSNAEFDATMRNRQLLECIVEMRQSALNSWEVNSTPSFIINNAIVISGNLSYDEFAAKINVTGT